MSPHVPVYPRKGNVGSYIGWQLVEQWDTIGADISIQILKNNCIPHKPSIYVSKDTGVKVEAEKAKPSLKKHPKMSDYIFCALH
jgi:hypothetical protein